MGRYFGPEFWKPRFNLVLVVVVLLEYSATVVQGNVLCVHWYSVVY